MSNESQLADIGHFYTRIDNCRNIIRGSADLHKFEEQYAKVAYYYGKLTGESLVVPPMQLVDGTYRDAPAHVKTEIAAGRITQWLMCGGKKVEEVL